MAEEAKKVDSTTAQNADQIGKPGTPETPQQAAVQQTVGEGSAKQGSAPAGAQGVPPGMQPTSEQKGTGEQKQAQRDLTAAEKADVAKATAEAEKAKAAGAELFSVNVDGVTVEVPKGTLVIEACFRAGADVPYFCYHPRLTSVGACRMCLASVELEQ